ncbi:MAG TPA: hypothetical protein VME66_03515, partial [Candidatus Acidoferrales bacterium]|nr:hypothetical protein [Candidatus Acidoferrales bacterium]
ISPSTQSVTYTVNGGTPVEQDLTPSSPGCGVTSQQITCTTSVTAPIGTDAFTVVTYDKTGGTGSVLSQASVQGTIVADEANVIPVVLNGVVASAVVQIAQPNPPAGTPLQTNVTLAVKDADGNTIVGEGSYIDATGTAVTFTLQDGDTTGATSIEDETIQGPGDSVSLAYTGMSLTSASITAVVQTGKVAASAVTGAVFAPAPTVTHEYPIGASASQPIGIMQDPYSGDIDFAESNASAIGIEEDGEINAISTISAGSGVHDFAVVRTGSGSATLWYSETAVGKVGSFTSSTDAALPTANGAPIGLTQGPDGNVWVCETAASKLARIVPNDGGTAQATSTEFALTAGSQPQEIVSGPNGTLWITEPGTNKIGVFSTTSDTLAAEYAIPTAASNPQGITTGADGALWFTESAGDKIGRITSAGTITEYTLPTANAAPFDIVSAPDGNLWFTEQNADQIGRITTAGVITEFPVPSASAAPTGITVDSEANVWFTEETANKIGELAY